MAAIFRRLTDSDEAAMQLALEFSSPMYLLYSIYDGAEDKENVAPLLDTHIERFIDRVGFGRSEPSCAPCPKGRRARGIRTRVSRAKGQISRTQRRGADHDTD